MPVQTQLSSAAKKFAGKLSAANAEYKDKPVDTGNMQLPPGIKNGIAKLQSIGWFVEEEDNRKTPKGEDKCDAVAVVLYPIEHDGVKCEGLQTRQTIPICDLKKADYQKEATTLKDNIGKFINLLKQLSNGTMVCQETNQTDPTGQKTLQYWFACMKSLSDPKRPPIYIRFTTSAFTPKKPNGWKEGDPVPEMRVVQRWHDLVTAEEVAKLVGQHNPANGVTVAGNTNMSPQPFEEPPQGVVDPKSVPSNNGQAEQNDTGISDEFENLEDEVTFLVATAMDEDGDLVEEARKRLQDLALENGWSQEQVEDPNKTWEDVGDMALEAPNEDETADVKGVPAIKSKWKYVRRDSHGAKMKTKEGHELPPLEVEVSAVDVDNKTCTVHTVKDNRVVNDIRTKKPALVKWEWLDPK